MRVGSGGARDQPSSVMVSLAPVLVLRERNVPRAPAKAPLPPVTMPRTILGVPWRSGPVPSAADERSGQPRNEPATPVAGPATAPSDISRRISSSP